MKPAVVQEDLLLSQREFFLSGKTRDLPFRTAQLKKLRHLLLEKEEEILNALSHDLRKSPFEAYTSEIMIIKNEIDLMLKNLKKWTAPRRVKTPLTLFPAKSMIYPEPYGVVLNISPWNYPFQLSLAPLVPILAAGNCAVLKPSEFAPATSALVARLIGDTFPEEYCAVVEGGIPETEELLRRKWDFIMFTGNPVVGKIVAGAAARNLTPTLLELGGKSPCIVHKDADIPAAARRIAWGKFYNAGQTCIAPDFVSAHKTVVKPLTTALISELKNFYGENPINSPDYGRIINDRHFQRLQAYLKDEKIAHGGGSDPKDLFIEPTLFSEVSFEHALMQDEIFGPLLPILEYEDIEELAAKLRTMEHPLALYLFSKDKKIQKKIIREISFGGGCINMPLMHMSNVNLPFGGVGNSGLGAYHGKAGFDSFTHYKSVLIKPAGMDLSLPYPPYGKKLNLVKKIDGA